MKVLAFDIYGDYAHFRKFYTTTSPLTFSFPPPPTIAGILGAIYGSDKNEYLRIFDYDSCKTALRIINPIKKMRISINLINTKDNKYFQLLKKKNHEPRIQVRTEFIKNPFFKIYVCHENESIFNALSQSIKEHRCVYSIALGLSELLADFKFAGVYEAEQIKNELAELSTPILASNIVNNGLAIESNKKYFKERMPIKMNHARVIEMYDDVIYEPDGKTIKANVKTYYKLENGENIAFF
jgi:CRISPR-associated protein Cas5h